MSLNSLVTGTKTVSTTMPSWYDQAQQNLVKNAQNITANTPSLGSTLAGQEINKLSGTNNPFDMAQQGLYKIGYGAANPWHVDPTTGEVTPDTSTALGGLFSAQDAQLRRAIPSIISGTDAGSVAGGGFGSLRNVTAADTAIGNAQANLAAEQMKAALTGQQIGTQAYQGLGNLGSQEAATMGQYGQLQQNNPLQGVANFAKILSTINAPSTTVSSEKLPLAQQLGGLGSLIGAGSNVLSQIPGLLNKIGGLFPGDTSGGGYAPGAGGYTPTDTSGSGGNYPYDFGTPSWDTGNWTPIDTTMGPSWSSSGSGQSADYTGGGYDPNAYADAYSYNPYG